MNISNKNSFSILLILLFSLCSCGKAPTVQTFPTSELSKLTDINLCYKYYSTNRGKAFTEKSRSEIEAEFKKRGLMTDTDLALIKDFKVEIGSSKYVMFASLGKAKSVTKTNSKTMLGGNQITEMYLFHNINMFTAFAYRMIFVTIENGKVSAVTSNRNTVPEK
jgi:hypothetical protein